MVLSQDGAGAPPLRGRREDRVIGHPHLAGSPRRGHRAHACPQTRDEQGLDRVVGAGIVGQDGNQSCPECEIHIHGLIDSCRDSHRGRAHQKREAHVACGKHDRLADRQFSIMVLRQYGL